MLTSNYTTDSSNTFNYDYFTTSGTATNSGAWERSWYPEEDESIPNPPIIPFTLTPKQISFTKKHYLPRNMGKNDKYGFRRKNQ